MSNLNFAKQDILKGSSKIFSDKEKISRIKYFKKYMQFNKTYLYKKQKSETENYKLLQSIKEEFIQYRNAWNEQPNKIIKNFYLGTDFSI